MINVRIVLRKKILSSGEFPVCLRVTKDRKTKYFKTIFNSTEDEWNSATGKFNKRNNNYLQNNRLLLKFQDRALKILGELKMESDDFTLEDFEKSYREISNPVQNNVFTFWNEIIEEMIQAGRMGNARINREAYKSILKFYGSKNLTFKNITPTFLNKYEVYMRSRGGTDGGIGVPMRALRALYNFAIERGQVKEEFYPFKIYKISKLKGKGLKKALSIEQVKKIVSLDLEKSPWLTNSRNFFVFSFYTRGMNFADMMKLEWKQVDEERIYYTRSKTKGTFIIKIVPPVQNILEFYKKQKRDTKYVFPILLHENLTPSQVANRKHKVLQRYNLQLKEIAEICGINKTLSSYVARHSFANCLKQKGIATDIISESLGHQNLAVTQAYLKELDSAVLDEAVEILL
ncbi:site-specific integrase [Salegentibacter sp. F188]|jgi:site-specific recombinase XerD|uniref:Site-specific integrase n=1 Tax=Autumnicola patrickiae TaxID=3075591 RepID=A0ABU3E404_9FLAO|nr:site-specific integrase [Salegentibacter sp. F188]MDT0690404.1 site-specific integrase [Salegentibacter sp. F188]